MDDQTVNEVVDVACSCGGGKSRQVIQRDVWTRVVWCGACGHGVDVLLRFRRESAEKED